MTSTLPVVLLLCFNAYVLLGAFLDKRYSHQRFLAPALLFFCSGMPALIYQIVWQRALFAIYGVNSESVTVVVTAFMIGLGLGSLIGGWLSTKFPDRGLWIFAAAEFAVALFGLASLRLFHWVAAHTAGAPLPAVVILSLALLIFPTVCMGATLPLLADHLVRKSRTVGFAVGVLYFANTFGSAFACFLCARFLLRDFGQSGSVRIAAGMNLLVAVAALLTGRQASPSTSAGSVPDTSLKTKSAHFLPLGWAMLVAASVGFISLGFEITWFRVFVLASSDRAPAFALLLATFLAGIAAGAFISGKLTEKIAPAKMLQIIANLIFLAAAMSCYLTPLVAWLSLKSIPFLSAAPAFFLVAALLGAVFTLVCAVAIPAGSAAGRGVSLIYIANIAGCASGSLLVGFILMNHFGLLQVTTQLALCAFIVGIAILFFNRSSFASSRLALLFLPLATVFAIALASTLHPAVMERLVFGPGSADLPAFRRVVENRNGVITVTETDEVFGSGVYDGYFNVDPLTDKNLIVRAYALTAFHPAPKRILMIGLSSGSWGQVLANNPVVDSLEVVEINPGYLQLISEYPIVHSLLTNPKVLIHVDDGRRWLLSHPDNRYDVIVQNTTFYWRDHTSELLSADYLRLIGRHLSSGGLYYYNSTGSDDVLATGLSVFPYGLRVVNFLAVSNSPLSIDKDRLREVLLNYSIDGHRLFDPGNSERSALLEKYLQFADTVHQPQVPFGIESGDSMRARIKNPLIISDDNMGWEWRELP